MIDKKIIIDYIARYFGFEADEDGKYDLDSYDWQAGAYAGTRDGEAIWMSAAAFVDIFDDLACDFGLYDDPYE